jgi:hypothetical protein
MIELENEVCCRCGRIFRKGQHQYADRSDLFKSKPLCGTCLAEEHERQVFDEQDEND